MTRRARAAPVLLALLLAAGCFAPGATEDAPAAGEPVAPAGGGGDALAPGAQPAPSPSPPPASPPPPSPATPSAPGASGPPPASGPPAPPPVWPAGRGTVLRDAVETAILVGSAVTLPARPLIETAGLETGMGEPVDTPVRLQSSQLLAGAPWAEVASRRVGFPLVAAYEGHVDGAPEQLVRLTVTPQWARGTVRVGDDVRLVRVGLDGNLPSAPGGGGDGEGGGGALSASHPWPGVAPPETFERADYAEEDCLRAAPPHAQPVLDLGAATAAPLVARVVLDGDVPFREALGADAFPMMVAFLHEVDAIYAHEVGIRFQLVGLHLHEDATRFPDPAVHAPLGALASYWNARPGVERDVVHLFTGRTSDYAQANCIGGAGHPEVAYTFTPLNWERTYPTFHTSAFAHELGHVFSAHHHYGNHLEARLATIMIQGYTPGVQPVFSTLSKAVIRGWAEAEVAG